MCKISVLMPVYNAELYLKTAIDSILSQTYQNFELVIIDDCSTDSSPSIVESYSDERIVFLKNLKNSGVAVTLNNGLEACCGEYIARMDADDISLPTRFETQLEFLETHKDVAVVTCGVRTFCADKTISESGWSNIEPEKIKKDLFFSCALAHPTVMMRRSALDEVGRYDPDYNGLEDYELWCRITEKYKISSVGEVLFEYRVHDGQVSKKTPEHVKKAHIQLKRRLINNIGAELSEDEFDTFVSVHVGGFENTDDNIALLHEAFCKIAEANERSGVYDSELLNADLRSVLISKTNKEQRKKILKRSKLLPASYIIKYEIKQMIKEFIKK